jgi:hypothetical protein
VLEASKNPHPNPLPGQGEGINHRAGTPFFTPFSLLFSHFFHVRQKELAADT